MNVGMAKPSSRDELKEYALRKLGKPVLEINVDDDQIEDLIDDAIVLRLKRRHVPVAVSILVDLLDILAGMKCHKAVQVGLVIHDLLRLNFDVDSLTRGTTKRLIRKRDKVQVENKRPSNH